MKKIEIYFDPNGRMRGLAGCYRVRLADAKGVHAAGLTPAEAVGDLFISHPERFGKRVETGWESVTAVAGQAVVRVDTLLPDGQEALGRLVLEHPDVFDVSLVLLRAHLWPVSTERAPAYIDI